MSFRVIELSSPHNPFVQDVRQAASEGGPTKTGLFIAEGPHLVEELLRGTWKVEKLIITPERFASWDACARELDVEVTLLPPKLLASIAPTGTTQGILALARPHQWLWDDLFHGVPLIVILDGVSDPGNAGTIVRSAEAFGASGVVFLKNSVRLSNPKLLRAAAGSLFRMPLLHAVDPADVLGELSTRSLPTFSLCASGELPAPNAPLHHPCVLIAGSEGKGISGVMRAASRPLSIPTAAVESLNVSVACSIALFEASRQRGEAIRSAKSEIGLSGSPDRTTA